MTSASRLSCTEVRWPSLLTADAIPRAMRTASSADIARNRTMRAMARTPQRLNDDEVAAALATLDGWRLLDGKLSREFVFANFVEAIGFMMRVAV